MVTKGIFGFTLIIFDEQGTACMENYSSEYIIYCFYVTELILFINTANSKLCSSIL